MTYKTWDIVLVPFPFTDQSSSKKRPGLIVSPHGYYEKGDCILCFITSKLDNRKSPGDYLIENWENAGLPKPSMLRMKMVTVHDSIIVKKIGHLEKMDQKNFKVVLRGFFDL